MGIKPEYPETGYGYIEQGGTLTIAGAPGAARVASFREKPELKVAREYLATGKYFWNAGIFIWKTDLMLSELHKRVASIPETLGPIVKEGANPTALTEAYRRLPKISIDHALLETSDQVALVPADIGWKDVGSWDALAECFPTDSQRNLLWGDVMAIDCKNVTVKTEGQFVACLGLENIVVVSTPDAILVCPTDRSQDVKLIVEKLKSDGRTQLT
jgi:mannose-1-phosphate guanylyltransferase